MLLSKHADPNALTGRSTIIWVTEANFGVPPPPVPPTPPLLLAAAGGHATTMKLLLAAGANPRFVAADGTNIVLAAAQGGSAAALGLALGLAPDVNVVDASRQTALHLLIGGGVRPELKAMMRILAARGARTDLANKYHMTAAKLADDGLTEVKAIFNESFPAPANAELADAKPGMKTAMPRARSAAHAIPAEQSPTASQPQGIRHDHTT